MDFILFLWWDHSSEAIFEMYHCVEVLRKEDSIVQETQTTQAMQSLGAEATLGKSHSQLCWLGSVVL